ncbi:MAG: PspC domain-containing protein [Eggerthellaceae bacterium]|nr:PspC domain-containing protein [Eggerthellaceae bacterium]
MAAEKRLYRKRNSSLAGVCSGLADYFDVDALVVRILAVLLTLVTFSLAAVAYLIMWAVVPLEPEQPMPYEVRPENVMSDMRGTSPTAPVRATGSSAQAQGISTSARVVIAVALVVLFFLASFNISPLVSGTQWWQFWPFAPLIVGLCLIVVPVRADNEGAWHALGIALAAVSATLVPLSVGIVSWETVPYGLQRFWWILVVAIVLFIPGLKRNSLALMMASALCVVVFCLCTLYFCAIPGVMESLVFVMPGGRSFIFVGSLGS